MLSPINKERLLSIAFIFIALFLLKLQNPPFFFFFPILLLTIVISWYLYKEIKRDNEESLKRAVSYLQEEQEAKRWLHKSFVPKARSLAKKEMRNIIIACCTVLLSFIFLWSFFVSGLFAAFINTVLGLLFFRSEERRVGKSVDLGG